MMGINKRNTIKDKEEIKNNIEAGVYSLFRTTKAILKNGYSSMDMMVILNNANNVTGNETIINPESASCAGFARVIEQEYSNISVKTIDFDNEINPELL